MTAALGNVEIDINLRLHDLARRVEQGIRRPAQRAAERMERDFERSGGRAGRGWAREFSREAAARLKAADLGKHLEIAVRVDEDIDQARRKLSSLDRDMRVTVDVDADLQHAEQRLRSLEQHRDVTVEADADVRRARATLDRLTEQHQSFTIDATVNESRGLRDLPRRLRDVEISAGQAGRALGTMTLRASQITLIGAGAGAALAGITSLTTGVLAFGAAVGQASGVAGLLPAGLATVAAGAGTAALAVRGLGDALENLDDPEALAEAMDDLAPSAQAFVRAIERARPAFDDMQLSVQQRAFAGLGSTLDRLGAAYLPRAERLFGRVADSMNRAARESAAYLTSSEGLGRSDRLVTNLGRAWDGLADAAKPAVAAMLGLTAVGSDFLPRMTDRVAELSTRFAEFIRDAEQSGRLTQYFEDSISTAGQLGRILADVGRGLGNVFSAANESGAGLLDRIEQITQAFEDWTASIDGQDTLGEFFTAMEKTSAAVLPVIGELASVIATTLAPVLADIATAVGPGAVEFIRGFGEALQNAGPGLTDFASAFGDLLSSAGSALPAAGDAVGVLASALGTLVGWVSPVVEAIGEFNDAMGGVPAKVAVAAAAVGVLGKAFSGAVAGVGGLSRAARREVAAVEREVKRGGSAAEKQSRSFGQKLSAGFSRGLKSTPFVGTAAVFIDEVVQLTDSLTGETAGAVEAVAISLGRAWDAITGQGLPVAEIRGQAQTVAEVYGEAVGAMSADAQREFIALVTAAEEMGLSQAEAIRTATGLMSEEYAQGLANLSETSASAWAGITEQTSFGAATAASVVSSASDAMGGTWAEILGGMATTTGTAWSSILGETTLGATATTQVVSARMAETHAAVVGVYSQMVAQTASGWGRMRSTTSSGAASVAATAAGVAGRILGPFAGLPASMSSVGADMMAGLRGGIESAAWSVVTSVTGVVGMAIKAARDAARTHSPSLEFADIGRDMGAGLAMGLDRSTRVVARAAEALSYSAMDPFAQATRRPVAASSGAAASASSRHVVINQNNYSNGPDARAVGDWALAGLQTAISRAGA